MAHPLSLPGEHSTRSRSPLPLLTVLLLAALYALFFGWLSLGRYWAYQMHALDMGNMAQAAWNTLHGHPFYFTNMRLPYALEAWGTTTRLSFHVEALFPVISLVYLVYPHPESLLVLQTVALALGAVPVFLLSRDVLLRSWLPVLLAGTYLLFPTLQAMNLYEFHPVALATPLLLFAFLFAYRRQYLPFFICALAAMGTKEQIGLVVALFGLYIAFVNRDWAVGLGTAALGTFWSLFAAIVVEHHFRPPGVNSYLKTRYGYLGHGVRGALNTIVLHPQILAEHVFTWPKAAYIAQLLAPTAFLTFLAMPFLLLGASTLGINLLSSDFHMYTALGDNSAEMIAVVMIASIFGVKTLLAVLGQRVRPMLSSLLVAAYVLTVALWNQHLNGFTPLGERFQVPAIGNHQRVEDRFVRMIPPNVPVSTQDLLDPHLSSRHYLYLFTDTGRPPDPPLAPANYILLDASATTYPRPSDQIHDTAIQYIQRPGWGVGAAQDGLILIRKGARSKHIPRDFYSFMDGSRARPAHPLGRTLRAINVRGYDVARVDLPNYRIPRLAYTVYLRPTGPIQENWQPVIYERIGRTIAACAHVPLGLAWLPTSRWKAGQVYAVRMDPMETDWSSPATAHLFLTLQRVPRVAFPTCGQLWKQRGLLLPAGALSISF